MRGGARGSLLVKPTSPRESKRPLVLLHEGKDSLIVGAGFWSEMQSADPRPGKL
jgi:hypothetical protein